MPCFYFSCLKETHTPRENPCVTQGFAILGLDRFLDGFRFEDQVLALSAGSGSQGAVLVFNAAEGADQETLHLGGGACDGGGDVVGVVCDGQRLVAFRTNFKAAAFVLRS